MKTPTESKQNAQSAGANAKLELSYNKGAKNKELKYYRRLAMSAKSEKVKQYIIQTGDNEEDSRFNSGETEVGYWRKANPIHKWMVDNIQDGQDECRPHVVSKSNLLQLKLICEMAMECFTESGVLKPNMLYLLREILPALRGLFFGELEYNADYWEDVKMTIEIIDNVIKDTDWKNEIIFYYSSW